MAKKSHIHRYRRITLGKNYKVFRCVKSGCSHYIPVTLVENAVCECNRCGDLMTMTKVAMTLARPHCPQCTKSKKAESISEIEKFLEEKLV